jgi:hypothetical protein
LYDQGISKGNKKRIYNTIIKSTVTCSSEIWPLKKRSENMLLTTEMDFWRRSAGSSRRERIRNERIRDIMKVNTTIVENIRTHQLRWYEHVVRMERERLPKQVLLWTGKKKKKKTKLDRRHTRGVETKRTQRRTM